MARENKILRRGRGGGWKGIWKIVRTSGKILATPLIRSRRIKNIRSAANEKALSLEKGALANSLSMFCLEAQKQS